MCGPVWGSFCFFIYACHIQIMANYKVRSPPHYGFRSRWSCVGVVGIVFFCFIILYSTISDGPFLRVGATPLLCALRRRNR